MSETTHFQSRYGQEFDGSPRGCPDGMYPWDADYESDLCTTFEELKAAAYYDSLNLPISWYFDPVADGGEFVLVFVMPRKYGKTWSIRLTSGYDRAEVEAWLEDWTHEVAATHYGWLAIRPGSEADQ